METATVVYHHEEGTWWAESEQIPGFTAAGETFDEARQQVRDGVRFAGWDGALFEILESGAMITEPSQAFCLPGASLYHATLTAMRNVFSATPSRRGTTLAPSTYATHVSSLTGATA